MMQGGAGILSLATVELSPILAAFDYLATFCFFLQLEIFGRFLLCMPLNQVYDLPLFMPACMPAFVRIPPLKRLWSPWVPVVKLPANF